MLNWLHIKGFNGTSNSDILYTYINFQSGILPDVNANDEEKANFRPTIGLNNTNTADSSLGYILCSNVKNTIYKDLDTYSNICFKYNGVNPYFLLRNASAGNASYLSIDFKNISSGDYNGLRVHAVNGSNYNDNQLLLFTPKCFAVNAGSITFNALFSAGDASSATHDIKWAGDDILEVFNSGSTWKVAGGSNGTASVKYLMCASSDVDTTYKYRFLSDEFISKNSIRALYFSATSDKRAKKDINAVTQSALNIVKNTQIYTFKYIDSQTTSLGVLAQELKDVKINDFDLIDNKQATGENNDFMSVKESKLVYVLWKAVQELSAEVQALKLELNK